MGRSERGVGAGEGVGVGVGPGVGVKRKEMDQAKVIRWRAHACSRDGKC